jgi:hypothetical protein
VTLPRELPPAPAGRDPSPAALAALHAELSALRLDCLRLERRSRELAFLVVGHNEVAALNGRLATVVALNRTRRPYHQSSVVAAWPDPPIPTRMLLSPVDLIPYLSAALGVLGGSRPREARHG